MDLVKQGLQDRLGLTVDAEGYLRLFPEQPGVRLMVRPWAESVVPMLRLDLLGLPRESITRKQSRALEKWLFMPDGADGCFYSYLAWPQTADSRSTAVEQLVELVADLRPDGVTLSPTPRRPASRDPVR